MSDKSTSNEDETATAEKPAEEDVGTLFIYYHFAEKVSKPAISSRFILPLDGTPVLNITASLGYDSYKRANLHVLDSDTIALIAGSYIRVHKLSTSKDTFIRCTGGGSISCLAVHPTCAFFASGERAPTPDVNVFGNPSCKLQKILQNGTHTEYVSLMFEPFCGDLLASQGGEPDFSLTIWQWQKEVPLLRCKSFSQEVYRIEFSQELFGVLVTTGLGHIRFWNMAVTFTGLKLKGRTGRFDARTPTNIETCIPFADGKVLSGSDEGTILLWEDSLLQAEFNRRRSPYCHNGKINQMFMHEGEVLTLGDDGYIRTWSADDMLLVQPNYHGQHFPIHCLHKVQVGDHSCLMYMAPANARDQDSTLWYAQDKEGKIWSVDMSIAASTPPPKVLLDFHGGPILACSASPVAHLLATAGHDGTVRIFDCLRGQEMLNMAFPCPVTSILWIPVSIDDAGASVIAGFYDGVIRKIAFRGVKEHHTLVNLAGKLSQVFKPHTSQVTSLGFSADAKILASGSSDKTIFFFNMIETDFEYHSWLCLPSGIRQLLWTPAHFSHQALLAVCEEGIVVQIQLTDLDEFELTDTFKITSFKLQLYRFHSIRSEVEKNEILAELREKKALRDRQKAETEDQDDQITEESQKPTEEDLELEKEEEREIFIPDSPSPILQAVYSQKENHFWLVLGEYDGGYVYLCQFPERVTDSEEEVDKTRILTKPLKAVRVPDYHGCDVTVLRVYESRGLVLLGFSNGHIRIVQSTKAEELNDLGAYWDMSAHDDRTGSLTGLELAFDGVYLATAGMDGNILVFSYAGLLEALPEKVSSLPATSRHHEECLADLSTDDLWFIDQLKLERHEYELEEAEKSKNQKRAVLKDLEKQLKSLLVDNNRLPPNIRLTREEMLINRNLQKEHNDRQQEKLAEVNRQYAWQSEKNKLMLDKLTKRFLPHGNFLDPFVLKSFSNESIKVKTYMAPVASFEDTHFASSTVNIETVIQDEPSVSSDEDTDSVESSTDELWRNAYMLTRRRSVGLTGTVARSLHMTLDKAQKAKMKRLKRKKEWNQLFKEQTRISKDDPKVLQAIEHARCTIGDLKLRSDPASATEMAQKCSAELLFSSLVHLDRTIVYKMIEFNEKVMKLREKKFILLRIFRALDEHLRQTSQGKKRVSRLPSFSEIEIPEAAFAFDEQILSKFRDDAQRHGTGKSYMKFKEAILKQRNRNKNSRHWYYRGERSDFPDIVSFFFDENIPTECEGEVSPMCSFDEINTFDLTSTLQEDIFIIKHLQTRHDLNLTNNVINYLMEEFDDKVRSLRKEQAQLDVLLKQADLSYIARMQEYLLDKATYGEEKTLRTTLARKIEELQKTSVASAHLRKQITKKTEESEELTKQSADLWLQFQTLCTDKINTLMTRFLTHLYKRKIAKSKAKDEDDEEDDDDWSESTSLSSDVSDEMSMSLDLQYCPDELDQELYDKVVGLQTQRQALDDAQAETKQELLSLNKELEQNNKEAEALKRSHQKAGEQLAEFHKTKIRLINEIEAIVVLPIASILSKIPSGLVLDLETVKWLYSRIPELKKDIQEQARIMKSYSRDNCTLRRSNRLLREKTDKLEAKCKEETLKKFGKLVNIRKLELVTMNPKLEMLKFNLVSHKDNQIIELKRLDNQIKRLKESLKEEKMLSTDRYMALSQGISEMYRLDKRLDLRSTTVNASDLICTGAERVVDRGNLGLRKCVKEQSEAIRDCWNVIYGLRSPNPHKLPPLLCTRHSLRTTYSRPAFSRTALPKLHTQ